MDLGLIPSKYSNNKLNYTMGAINRYDSNERIKENHRV